MQQVAEEVTPWFTFSLTEGMIFTKHMIIEGDKHIFHISYRDNNFSVWSSVKQTCITSCWDRYVLNTICILCLLANYDDRRFVAIKKGSGNIASDYRGRETLMIFNGRDQGGRSAKINHYAGPCVWKICPLHSLKAFTFPPLNKCFRATIVF